MHLKNCSNKKSTPILDQVGKIVQFTLYIWSHWVQIINNIRYNRKTPPLSRCRKQVRADRIAAYSSWFPADCSYTYNYRPVTIKMVE